jgi:HD superfamily phosphohydrolase
LPLDFEFKLIRCPLYGFVGISKKEDALLDTVLVQRLSRLKQLAHTYIVYPSAVHTRLEHSLGTLYLAGRICDQLKIPLRRKEAIRIAALLHDIGQGPFSHIWEEPMRWVNGEEFSHEDLTKLMVQSDPEIGEILGNSKEEVLGVLDNESLDSDIISSSLDVDKLDYLRRDSYHTGVAYGLFDIERIVRTLCKISENGREYLAVQEKGKDALESYRLARYAMHMQVYEHHTRLIADDMFLKATKLALADGSLREENLKIEGDPIRFSRNFAALDDFSIQHLIMENSRGPAKDILQAIRRRKLLKRALVTHLTKDGVENPITRKKIGEMNRKQIAIYEKKIAEEVGIDPAYVIVHVQSSKIKLYERFDETLGEREKPIYVLRKNGSFFSFDEESPISASLAPVRTLYVFCPEKNVRETKRVSESIFRVKSCF